MMARPNLEETSQPVVASDRIVTKRMMFRISFMAAVMSLATLGFVLFGERVIPESNEEWQYGKEGSFVFPGRPYDWDGNILYREHYEKDGTSRHMTWVFQFFMFMQIWNMTSATTVADDAKCCKVPCQNCFFY